MLLLSSADFLFKINFLKNSFRNTIRVSNCLDPNQERLSVGSDLGPNCLQRLSADNKSKERIKSTQCSKRHDNQSFSKIHKKFQIFKHLL